MILKFAWRWGSGFCGMPIRQEASAGCSILRFQLVSCLIDPVRFPMARLAAYVLACGLLIAGAMRPDASSVSQVSG